jgi:hypothetical protein
MLEHALEARSLSPVRRIRFVAAVALVVVEAASYDLFGGEAELGVGLAALVASCEQADEEEREGQHQRGNQN